MPDTRIRLIHEERMIPAAKSFPEYEGDVYLSRWITKSIKHCNEFLYLESLKP